MTSLIHFLKHHSLTLLVLSAALVPRFMMLGNYPSTDEGYYAFIAKLFYDNLSTGNGLPDHGPISLYPLIVAWVFHFEWNYTMVLRAIDAMFALIVAALLFRIAEKESGSRIAGALIATAFTFVMNAPEFIQNGFKNSIFIAYIPLLLAIYHALYREEQGPAQWLKIGGLVALAVLLRESFITFAVIGGIALVLWKGPRAATYYVSGGLAAAFFIVLVLAILHPDPEALIQGYKDAGAIYSFLDTLRWQHFFSNGTLAVKTATGALALGFIGLASILILPVNPNLAPNPQRWAFWLGLSIIPLLEPLLKLGFPYHFAVCLIGLCGMAALGWKTVAQFSIATRTSIFLILLTVYYIASKPIAPRLAYLYTDRTLHTLPYFNTPTWPDRAVSRSNYLLITRAIQQAAPNGGTLSVSGFMYALFPLSGLHPPSYDLSNLSAAIIKFNMNDSLLQNALQASMPDVVVVTMRDDWPGQHLISSVVDNLPEYSKFETVPVVRNRDYGRFGAIIYQRVNGHP